MKNERRTGSTQIQQQISKIRSLYESIGMPINFEMAVDLSQYLGKALDMAKQKDEKPQKKRYVM